MRPHSQRTTTLSYGLRSSSLRVRGSSSLMSTNSEHDVRFVNNSMAYGCVSQQAQLSRLYAIVVGFVLCASLRGLRSPQYDRCQSRGGDRSWQSQDRGSEIPG